MKQMNERFRVPKFKLVRVITVICIFLLFLQFESTVTPAYRKLAMQQIQHSNPITQFNSIKNFDENVGGQVPEKCSKIWLQPNPCLYVQQNCAELSEGFIDFLDIYYCHLNPYLGPAIAVFTMISMLGLMFLFLGTVASDFFCPNLSTISQSLELSESVAGVTFLAFGNGSPDLFSTFSALKAGSGALAMGELIGAAWFVTSVVVGTMAVVKSFHVVKQLFLRDLLFFTGAVIWMISIVWDRKLTKFESIGLVLYYLTYVITVVYMNYFSVKGMQPIHTDPSTRALIYGVNESGSGSSFPNEIDAELEGLLMSNLEHNEIPSESTRLISQMQHASPLDMSPTSIKSANSNDERLPMITPITYYKKLSFWTVDEITRALNNGQDNRPINPRQRRRTEFLPVSAKLSSRVLGGFFNESPPMRPIRTYSDSSIANQSTEPITLLPNSGSLPKPESPSRVRFDIEGLAPTPSSSAVSTPNRFKRPNAPISIAIPEPDRMTNLSLSPYQEIDPPQFPSYSEPVTASTDMPVTPAYQRTALWQLLFPGLCDWRQLTMFEKLFNLVSLPAILILTLTIPTPAYDDDLNLNSCMTPIPHSDIPTIIVNSPMQPLPLPTPPTSATWYKFTSDDSFTADLLLSTLQAFTIPIFLFETVLVSNDLADRQDIVYAVGVGSILAIALMALRITTRRYRTTLPHPTKLIKSLLGFAQSLCWISMTANEVVDILRALGVIFNINEEIIGLTVFAVGNSLGDLVANFSVARMGYPMMAVSACFAGPMLNMMLGPGLAGTYLGITRGEPISIPVTQTMVSAGFAVLITLLTYNLYLHHNQFRIGRKFGVALIAFYFMGMCFNVLATIYNFD